MLSVVVGGPLWGWAREFHSKRRICHGRWSCGVGIRSDKRQVSKEDMVVNAKLKLKHSGCWQGHVKGCDLEV